MVAPRRDEFAAGESTLKQEIEKLKQLIEQDAKLWSEIAPIVERFGVESQDLAEYQQQYDAKKQQDETAAQQYEQKRQQHENNANHWQSQIKTWGVVGHRRRKRKTVPVYGWIHNSAAEANYNNERAAAETAAKNRDAALELPTAKAYRDELTELQTKQAQLQDALGLVENKAVVLREQQIAFHQKRTLLTAENEVILAEKRLLDACLITHESEF